MKLVVAALLFCAIAATTRADHVCEVIRNERIKGFNGQPLDVPIPCKYWALKEQKCGDYKITLSPGNKWFGNKYRLDTIWLGVKSAKDSSKEWKGRTTNKIAVKFVNVDGKGRHLFNYKGGSMSTDSLFKQGIDSDGPYVEDKGGNFKVHFSPWHPKKKTQKRYEMSTFKFTCMKDMEPFVPYPRQMCGNLTTRVVFNRGSEFLQLKRSQQRLRERLTIYYDMFMNEDVSQMEGRCVTAVNILKNNCSGDQDRVLNTLSHCEQIIGSTGKNGHTECVTKYSCHPMDIMNACLEWGCAGRGFEKGKDYEDLCLATAEGVDLCQPFFSVHGNLTGLIKSANCFKDFLVIQKPKKSTTALEEAK